MKRCGSCAWHSVSFACTKLASRRSTRKRTFLGRAPLPSHAQANASQRPPRPAAAARLGRARGSSSLGEPVVGEADLEPHRESHGAPSVKRQTRLTCTCCARATQPLAYLCPSSPGTSFNSMVASCQATITSSPTLGTVAPTSAITTYSAAWCVPLSALDD